MVNSVFRDNLFQGKVALITGGGTGIGLRTARELSELGATVILASRQLEHVSQATEMIRAEGGQAHGLICNIREEESIQQCLKDSLQLVPTIDFLVNNGGGQFPSPAENINRKGWNAVIETNLTGTFFMSQAIFQQVFRKKGGVIVNVIANMWRGFPIMSHTGAARAGVDNLTKTLANEWGRYGVRVNAVAPGVIESSGLERYAPEVKPFIMQAATQNQAYRLGTEAEVAASIVFLLSPAAAFITGETLRVDGGDSIYCPMYPPVEHTRCPPFDDPA